MPYSISRKSVTEQPVLVQRKRAGQGPEISKAISEGLGAIFAYAQEHGIAVTGQPFARYLDVGPGSTTLEPGVPVAVPEGGAGSEGAPDDAGSVRIDALPGGTAAFTVHQGPYDTLHEAYAALESWMKDESLSPAGAPWEVYVTDPTQVESPEDWKTEVYWPVA